MGAFGVQCGGALERVNEELFLKIDEVHYSNQVWNSQLRLYGW